VFWAVRSLTSAPSRSASCCFALRQVGDFDSELRVGLAVVARRHGGASPATKFCEGAAFAFPAAGNPTFRRDLDERSGRHDGGSTRLGVCVDDRIEPNGEGRNVVPEARVGAVMCASTTPRRRSAKAKRLPPDRDQPCGRSNRFPATGAAHGRTTFPCRNRGGIAFSISDLHHSAGRRQPVLADLAEQAARLIPRGPASSDLGNAWPRCGPSPAGRRRRRTP
jgi:hypothetical protein